MLSRALVSIFFLLASSACSNGGGGGNDAGADALPETGPTACTSDTDCPMIGYTCWYPINGGCTLQGMNGQCLFYSQTSMCVPNVGCGCDGTTISVCGPPGVVNRPSQMSGVCPMSDAGPDVITDGSSE